MNFRRFEGLQSTTRTTYIVMWYSKYGAQTKNIYIMWVEGNSRWIYSIFFAFLFFKWIERAMFSFASGCYVIKMNIIVFPYININEMFTLLTVASIFDIRFSMFTWNDSKLFKKRSNWTFILPCVYIAILNLVE